MRIAAWAENSRALVRGPASVLLATAALAGCASGPTRTRDAGNVSGNTVETVPRGAIVYAAPYRSDSALFVLRSGRRNPRRITSWGEAPAWSPRGDRLAYSSTDSGTWIARADGTRARDLAGIGLCYAPAWSPDGRTIACFGPTGFDGSMSLTYDDPPSLWLIDVARERARRLCSCGDTYDDPVEAPSWSPDGTQLVFSDGGIKVIDVKSRRLRSLGAGRNPDWSPDGRQIAYSSGDDIPTGHTIGVMRADGSRRHVVVSSPIELVDQPAWAPDGTQLVYATFAPHGSGWRNGYWGASRGLRVVNLDGRKVKVLTRRGFEPDWR